MTNHDIPIPIGRIDLGPTESHHLTQIEQRVMDAALRRSVAITDGLRPMKYQVWLSPKAARFAAHACDVMACSNLDDENDSGFYRAIAQLIREAIPYDSK